VVRLGSGVSWLLCSALLCTTQALLLLLPPHHHDKTATTQSPLPKPTAMQQPAPGVEALPDAVQHSEGPHHKGEGGREAEGLVIGRQQQVLFGVMVLFQGVFEVSVCDVHKGALRAGVGVGLEGAAA